MQTICHFAVAALLATLFLVPSNAQDKDKEKDILNYAGQKNTPKDVKKIVFIADKRPHGPKGNHEFAAGAVFLAKTINANYKNAYCVVHGFDGGKNKFPEDIGHADAFVVLLNHAGPAAMSPAIKEAVERGAGFMAVHYGVEVNKGEQGERFLKWMGGYFEPHWSVNPHWTPDFKTIPKHEVTRGVKPFSVNDEWYYHMRFANEMKGVTPILTAVPDIKTLRAGADGKSDSHGGNPSVYKEVKEGKAQHVAWAYERPGGGRGFGFTGYHVYDNLKNDSFRTLLLNAVAWSAGLEVPAKGIPSNTPTGDDLENWIKEGLRVGK